MTQPRKTLVSIESTPYYHCMARCVRRAFLCGVDSASGRSYGHRRRWVRERLAVLSRVFAIELCAYAVMSNHYHLVVRLRPEQVAGWSDEEVITRWTRLFSEPPLVARYRRGDTLTFDELRHVRSAVAVWRERLGDLSWYMRCLNEYIARRANAEDGVTGHFWEARFKSQALLDEGALLQVMVYVDLNPVRAGMATTIGDSSYTAAQQRLMARRPHDRPQADTTFPTLAALRERSRVPDTDVLPFSHTDYLDLVDKTGRCCIPGKRGTISGGDSRLLTSLGLDAEIWMSSMRASVRSGYPAIGSRDHLRRHAARLGRTWVHGMGTVSVFPRRRDASGRLGSRSIASRHGSE